ncbi:MAG: hypothetical protein ACXVD0_04100 [Nocardioides sp.]
MTRLRFDGRIAGVGSTSGTRVVVGRWADTPYGAFADAMVETAAGHRVLLAPSDQVADLLDATYFFDEVRVEPFAVTDTRDGWAVRSPSLTLDLALGGRTAVGRLLRVVPRRLAESPAWCAVTDPGARLVMRGVRTRGSAKGGRREWYGATDARAVVAAAGAFDGAALGALAPVDPPCRYGFSSAPRRPSVTEVVSTIEV